MGTRAWALLLVLCGTIFLEGIDVAMMAVAIPSIRADLGLSTGTAAWVMSAYVLGYAGFTLLGGRAADLLGRRRMFLLWLTVFLGFSGLGGFATEGWMLILARFVTGVASAFMTPAALSLITTSYEEGPRRNKALLIFAGTAAGGFSFGLVAGGLLTELGWRWVFFAPVLLTAALLLAAVRLVPRQDAPRERGRGFDLPGAILAAGAMLLAAYTVVRLEHGLDDWPLTAAAALAALLLAVAFVAVERRSADPLVRLGILRVGPVVRADLGALLFVGAFFGFQFVVTLYLQELRGWSSLQTALALVIMGCDAVLAPTLTPRLVARYGNTRVIVGGFALAVLAYALFLPVGMDWPYLVMLPTLFVSGTAFALAYGPLTIAATEGVAEEEQGLASGLLTTATQFGSAIGISAVTAVYGLASTGSGPDATLSAFRTALVVPVAMVTLGLLVSARSALAARRAERQASAVSSVSASHTSANPAQRSGGMASRK
ncbi:transmembrane efflux protein [Streptomyces davaonensis JCM 4913]|uniref:Transmembrane efflux protein n=1 Tax=Streptomyces davaonensis (strain DSM 101723 / JCM 4913 / KCC S-0913 / 768) TaxID=1214101 RepID=K4R487_STRDJ|nr:MFS transporter [Streptomyces davaonensis]CCK28163.1 transmembrane efflux protein [Streptomyces davaonensis JCM 4913]